MEEAGQEVGAQRLFLWREHWGGAGRAVVAAPQQILSRMRGPILACQLWAVISLTAEAGQNLLAGLRSAMKKGGVILRLLWHFRRGWLHSRALRPSSRRVWASPRTTRSRENASKLRPSRELEPFSTNQAQRRATLGHSRRVPTADSPTEEPQQSGFPDFPAFPGLPRPGLVFTAQGGNQRVHTVVVVLERVLAQDGLVGAVIEFQVHPVNGVVAAGVPCRCDELAAQMGAG